MKLERALEAYGLKPTQGQRILNAPIIDWERARRMTEQQRDDYARVRFDRWYRSLDRGRS